MAVGRRSAVPETYRAAVCDEAGHVRLVELRSRAPEPREVVVRIVASGICHTDLRSLGWGWPFVLGHEGVGVVVDAGSAVGVTVGAPVVLNWAQPCGSCGACRRGEPALCSGRKLADPAPVVESVDGIGYARSFRLGTFAEYTTVDSSAITPVVVPARHDLATLCSIGCAGLTAYGAAARVARVSAGDRVAVIGVGSVGVNVVQACVVMGAARIIAIDRSLRNLQRAAASGATDLLTVDDDVDHLQAEVVRLLGT